MESIHEIVGRLVEKRNRRYFDELTQVIGYKEPELKDLSFLPKITGLFCDYKNLPPAKLKERSYNREASYCRLLCIAVLFKFYYPNALNPSIQSKPENTFKVSISVLLDVNRKKIGVKIKNALFLYQHNRIFRTEVDELYGKITQRIS